VTAAIVSDQWIWSGAAGVDATGTRLTPVTSLGIASVTKTFVAAEVLLLAQAGKVDLDAPLTQYVRHRLTANNATVRQHLSMTSGVPDYRPGDYEALDPALRAAPGRHWTAEQALSYVSTPVGSPGTYDYSNPSYLLLGMLIEKVTRQPLATVLRRDLAQPAGLPRVAFQDGEKPRPPIARTRNPVCGPAFDGFLPCRAIASAAAANGGATADAPTVARWGYHLYGGRVLPADLVAAMTAGDGDYGLGTKRFSLRFGNSPAYGHDGNFPDHCSILVAIPERRFAIAVLVAEGAKSAGAVASDLVTAALPLLR
jgi:CubicO group peptidase (beta-lactamase class C family)